MTYQEIEFSVLSAIDKIKTLYDLDMLEEVISLALDKKYDTFLEDKDENP
jgi:hypothetical protein